MFNYDSSTAAAAGGVSEIEELEDTEITSTDHHHHINICSNHQKEEEEEEDSVYVAVGKSDTSMEALSWTLKNMLMQQQQPTTSSTHHSSTIIYLIHVFPQIKHIPNPLGVGTVPRNQVSGEQVETYIAQERTKRRDLLHKFLQSCSISKVKVKVDTILIESDLVAKAILDLIPILQITNLVIGANKFFPRKSRSRRSGNGIADEVLKNAPESCKVRIICEGKEVIINNDQQMSMSLSLSPSPPPNSITTTKEDKQKTDDDSVLCICFKPKFK